MPRHWTIAACLSLCLSAASAQAETPAAFAARGTIVSADAANLTLKEADGTQDSFALAPGIRLLGMKTASLADVKAGDFVGIGSGCRWQRRAEGGAGRYFPAGHGGDR